MKTLIWLDDIRNPFTTENWLSTSPIDKEELRIVVWVKSYQEFKDWITKNGLPDGICFDHDLSDFQAMKSGFPEMMEDVPWPDHEKTGLDCAKWLAEYCMDNSQQLPLFKCHSSNPAGRENILGYLNNYLKSAT